MAVKQISVFLENRAGTFVGITSALAAANVNIRALTVSDTARFGILRLIVDKPDEAEAALKNDGYTVSMTNVMAVRMDDNPGGLLKVTRILADYGINIDYVYAFISHTTKDACVIIRVGDIEFAEKILVENGIQTFSVDD